MSHIAVFKSSLGILSCLVLSLVAFASEFNLLRLLYIYYFSTSIKRNLKEYECLMTSTEPLSFMKPQQNKAQMQQSINHCEQRQPSLLNRIDMNDTSSLSLRNRIGSPSPDQAQQPSLLSRIDLSNTPLLDRLQLPEETRIPPLLMRISTTSSRVVDEGEQISRQQPNRCLSPWNGSPAFRPIPERRLSSPILPKSIPLSENLPNPLSLFERMLPTPEQTTKRKNIQENKDNPPRKRRQTTNNSTNSFPKDRHFGERLTTNTTPDPNDNAYHNQICPGTDHRVEENLPTELLVATEPVNFSSYTGKILPVASFLSELPATPPKEYRPPNGSGFLGEKHLTSTISSLQSSALRSMKTGRLALERHISLLAQARPKEGLEMPRTGQQHGVELRRPSSSLSPTAEKNWTFTKDTYRSSSTQNNHTPIRESYHTTSQSEIMLEEDKQLCSPTPKNSPTYFPPLSYQTVSNSLPRHPTSEKQHLAELLNPQKSVTSSTLTQGVPIALAVTGTRARSVGGITRKTIATVQVGNEEGLQPKYRRYNLWGADHQKTVTIAEWSETAVPLPRPPKAELENTISNSTLNSHPHLFAVKTPINIPLFQTLLSEHPNQPFVNSVIAGLREGFWPWANTLSPGLPATHAQEPNGLYNDAHLDFFRAQLQHELERDRYSPSLGSELLPGMYSMPIYAVPKPGSTELRLVNDHSAGVFSLNSMIEHDLVMGYPLDNLHQLGHMLLDLHDLAPSLDLVMWKSDIAEAYRMCPMHPLWQIKQAVNIDGNYYIDRANCFGSSASFAIFVSVNSLIAWIAKKDRGVTSLITYVDDSSGPALAGDVLYYEPYMSFLPSPQVLLLRLWDELGVPHKIKKQVHGNTLTIIGIDVDPNALTFTLPDVARDRLILELETWISDKSSRYRLRRWQKLAGWINWALNVYPDLRPCLNAFYCKIAGKTKPSLYVRINNDVRDDFKWALDTLQHLPPVRLLHSLSWGPMDASLTVYCDACPKGMGFWFPATNAAFYSDVPAHTPPLIYYTEALCVLSAIQHCCDIMLSHQRLLIYTDNMNVVDIFSSLRCLPEFNIILKKAVTFRVAANVDVRVLHVSGDQNTVADAVSRALFDHAKTLSPLLTINTFTPPNTVSKQDPLTPPLSMLGAAQK